MKLHRRISIAAVFLILFTGLLLGLLSVRELRHTLESEHLKWSATMAQAVAKAITTQTLKHDEVGVRKVLKRVIATNDDLAYLLVVDFRGNVLTSTFPGRLPPALRGNHHDCPRGKFSNLRINGRKIQDICYSLINGMDAHLHIGLRETRDNQLLNAVSQRLAWGILGVSLLGAMLAFYMGRRISRPITKLSSALHAYGQGAPLIDLPNIRYRDREIRELLTSFQSMVEERSLSEAELRSRTKQLESVLNASPVIMFSCDQYGVFTMSEGAALTNLGLEPGQVVGQSIFDVYADNPDIISVARRVLNGETMTQIHEQLGRKLETHWTPLWNSQHEIDGVLGVAVDITERVQHEQENQRLADILEATTDLVSASDPDGNLIYMNRAGRALCGKLDTPIAELKIPDFHPPWASEKVLNEAIPYAKEHGTWQGMTVLLDKDGNEIPASQVILTHRDAAGNLIYISTIIRDMSDQRKAEQQLQELNKRLEKLVQDRTATVNQQSAILEQIHDSVITADMDGMITGWNQGAERMFGYTAVEMLGRQVITSLYPQDQQQYVADRILKLLDERGDHETEVTMQRKNGECFDALLSLSLLRDAQGVPYGRVGYVLDISDRKRAERDLLAAMQQAEEASRAKSEFLSRMSHELRTPMNAILGFSQLLEQNIDGNLNETELVYVDEVLKGGHHLLELINEVLDLSRIESGNMQVSLEPVELHNLLEECIALVEPMAESNQVSILPFEESREICLNADRMRLKQVIINLLSNAVKYNHSGGRVTLSYDKHHGRPRLSIVDTGPGIPKSLQSRVFEPFDRLNAANSKVEGTGIGLSLAKRLIELMGGEIGFDSVEGQGSSFWIALDEYENPPQRTHDEPDRKSLPTTADSRDSHYEILYVEDNPANLRLVKQLLEKFGGVDFYDAHNVSLAMDLIRHHHFDLILLDIHLSGAESGYDILKQLQAEPSTRDIPVVAISANAMPRDIEHGLASGFHDYLTKPIDVHQFHAMLVRHLGDGSAE